MYLNHQKVVCENAEHDRYRGVKSKNSENCGGKPKGKCLSLRVRECERKEREFYENE